MKPAKLRRLDQLLSSCGYCSRSEAGRWVKAGRVFVSGAPATRSDDKVDAEDVLVDGLPVECPEGLLALFHKPAGCVCSHDSREGQTIYDLLPPQWLRRNPPVTSVGRLDRDTTGVLLLTDDGTLVQRWTSPRHKVPKVYDVTVDADLQPPLIPLFAAGQLVLEDEDKPCLPAKLEFTGPRDARLELIEGRFHQVKRMFATQGLNVTRLHRSQFGDYVLEDLPVGAWRMLSAPSA
jgi:16S rRNA pseudouridine516 synthase